MWLFGFSPRVFFIHQLLVALLEIIGLMWMSYKLIPSINELKEDVGWSFKPIKPVLKFALTSAFTSAVWVAVTQIDKLVLSGILSLAEYGNFTLAVLVAAGIMTLSGPISSAVIPRMTRLFAEGNKNELLNVYKGATQLVSVIAGSTALVIAFLSEPILYAWTGNIEITAATAPILSLYALGNCFLIIAAFPYYLQYALGNLRYHLIGNLLMVIILIPTIIYAAKNYGGVGAGYVWLFTNALFLLTWVGYVHHKLIPGLHLKWFFSDVLSIYLPVAVLLVFFQLVDFGSLGRLGSLILAIAAGLLALLVGGAASSTVRNICYRKFHPSLYKY
jgi:O-antigen/teichoic acid export membrane protein